MKKIVKPALLLITIAILAVLFFSRLSGEKDNANQGSSNPTGAEEVCERYLSELFCFTEAEASEQAQPLMDCIKANARWEITDFSSLSDKSATCNAILYLPAVEKLDEKANELISLRLQDAVQKAAKGSEIYNDSLEYRNDILEEQFDDMSDELYSDSDSLFIPQKFNISLGMENREWFISDDGGAKVALEETAAILKAPDEFLQSFKERLFSSLEYIRKEYAPIDDSVTRGYFPDENCYGESDNAEYISALLSSPRAAQLIGNEKLSWSENVQYAPNTRLRYYLDDTILVLVWKELHGRFIETFSEVFIADGSQLRRKLTDDTYHSESLLTVQELAEQTNAVLAESGDMSGRRNRDIGIFVYNREIFRFEPDSGDTCFITSGGNLLFSRRHELTDRDEAEKFIKDNDVLFSLCFGPVMVENGELAVPTSYPWGEAYESYMRNSFGQIGERHYLIYNSDFMTVTMAAKVMLERGCVSAYALDGGFTACTVLNNLRINPIVGEERPVSDIICYVTAVPDDFQG